MLRQVIGPIVCTIDRSLCRDESYGGLNTPGTVRFLQKSYLILLDRLRLGIGALVLNNKQSSGG